MIKRATKILMDKVRGAKSSGAEYLSVRRARLSNEVKLSKRPAKAALIGCGTMGGQIAAATKMLPGWELSHFYDMHPAAASRLQAKYSANASVHESLSSLLEALNPQDILIVASNADSHISIADQAIKQGLKKIFLEKPIGTNIAGARKLTADAVASGVLLTIDHTRRWAPVFEAVKRMILTGVIGKPHSVNFLFGRAGFAMIGTHLFDLSRWLFDSDIVRLRGCLDDVQRSNQRGQQYVDPAGRCEFELRDGVIGTVDLSDRMELRHNLTTITGERGRIEIDQRQGKLRLLAGSGKLWEQDFVNSRNLALAIASALNDMNLGRKSRCSGEDGCAALEAAIAVTLSDREGGRWVELPLSGAITLEKFPFA